MHCDFAHDNIIPVDEPEWDDRQCTGRIIPKKVLSFKEYFNGRKLIHCTYSNGKSHADYPDRFRKKRNDT